MRRGYVGWIAVLVALGCAAAVFLLGSDGALEGRPVETAAICVGGVLAGVLAYRRLGRSSRVRVDADGTLALTLGSRRHRFDLADADTEVSMQGRPGDRGWAVEIGDDDGADPVRVTAAAVDPPRFTEVLRQWRPDL